jgi:hypothetical protein
LNSPLTRLSVNSPLLPPDLPADAVGVLTWFFPLPMMELVVQGYVVMGGWMGIESSPIDQKEVEGLIDRSRVSIMDGGGGPLVVGNSEKRKQI